jgi:ankyrin repeat protein
MELLPLELTYLICEKLRIKVLVEISIIRGVRKNYKNTPDKRERNILRNYPDKKTQLYHFNKNSIKKYWLKNGINALVWVGDFLGMKYLIKHNKYFRHHDNDNNSLIVASKIGHLEMVKFLVNRGAWVGCVQNSAVILASEYGYLSIVKFLVYKGADIKAQDNAAVIWACKYGHLEVVKYLVSLGADITAKNNLAIIWATGNGHLDVVKYLVENGVNVTVYKNHVLKSATEKDHLDIVKYILDLGYSRKIFIDKKDVRKIISVGRYYNREKNVDILEEYLRNPIN